MHPALKKALRFVLRQYALIGAVFQPGSHRRAAFRESVDQIIISLYRDDINLFIRSYPTVWSEEETILHIFEHNSSICRFGDGEFDLLIGDGIVFQDVSEELNRRMLEVLRSNHPNILIGIHPVRDFEGLGRIWQKVAVYIGDEVLNLLDPVRSYPSMGAFRVLPTDSRNSFIKRIKLIKKIWQDRDIVLVVGKNSRFTFEEELFNNTKSVNYIYAPPKNAFTQYDEIMKQVQVYDKTDYLILVVLGPTATVLAYDLALQGYQAIDFGQMPGTFRRGKTKLWGSADILIPQLQKTGKNEDSIPTE